MNVLVWKMKNVEKLCLHVYFFCEKRFLKKLRSFSLEHTFFSLGSNFFSSSSVPAPRASFIVDVDGRRGWRCWGGAPLDRAAARAPGRGRGRWVEPVARPPALVGDLAPPAMDDLTRRFLSPLSQLLALGASVWWHRRQTIMEKCDWKGCACMCVCARERESSPPWRRETEEESDKTFKLLSWVVCWVCMEIIYKTRKCQCMSDSLDYSDRDEGKNKYARALMTKLWQAKHVMSHDRGVSVSARRPFVCPDPCLLCQSGCLKSPTTMCNDFFPV